VVHNSLIEWRQLVVRAEGVRASFEQSFHGADLVNRRLFGPLVERGSEHMLGLEWNHV
jgi:hypothetical protein